MRTFPDLEVTVGHLLVEGSVNDGHCRIPYRNHVELCAIVSAGLGWDHVSVSTAGRCPNWAEMKHVKDLFFNEDECVIQYMPPDQDYVNIHPYVLHMWRPQEGEIPMPPMICV